VPGTIGFALATIMKSVDPVTGGARLINIAVFGAALSYVLMMVSHIVLRKTAPDLPRPYRTPGGVVTTSVALVLAVAAVIATFFVDEIAAAVTAGIVLIAVAYYWFYSRHHLVANAPEEEFAAIAKAEAELD
jgi:ethanolamine permease